MKLTTTRESLRAALDVVRPAIKARSPLPALANVLLEATPDGGLHVAGTDLETRAWHTVPADVDEAGSVTLPPEQLTTFLDAIPEGATFSLVVNDAHKASLSCGKTQAKIPGIDAEEFPPAFALNGSAFEASIPTADFARIIGSVAHAIAPDDSRPVLAGVLILVQDGRLSLVTADGFRLAMAHLAVDAPDVSLIAAGRPLVTAVGKLAKAETVRLSLPSNQSHLALDSDAGSWAVRVIDGQFPDYRRILPTETPHAVTVDRDDFLRAVRLVQKVEEGDRGFMARLTIQDEQMEVRAGSKEGDQQAETVIGTEMVRGDGMQIAFNARYLREAIEATEADRVLLEMSMADRPARLCAVDLDAAIQVLMPMYWTK